MHMYFLYITLITINTATQGQANNDVNKKTIFKKYVPLLTA